MSLVKYVDPQNSIWDLFCENRDRLSKELVLIAEDDELGLEVCVTEENGALLFVVLDGGQIEFKGSRYDRTSSEATLQFIYDSFFKSSKTESEEVNVSRDDYEDKIYEREDELYLAAADFLSVLLCKDDPFEVQDLHGEEFIDEFVDYICEYLRNECGISVYRPVIIDLDDGTEEFEDYPYD